MKKFLLGFLVLMFFIVSLQEAPILALFFLLGAFLYYKKRKSSKNPASTSPISTTQNADKSNNSNKNYPNKKHICFRVAGISKKNDRNEDIQKLIKGFVKQEIEMQDYSYDGMTNKEIFECGKEVYEADIDGCDEISFVPEPDNPYDPNAIKVIHDEIGHIGYVPADMAKRVSDIISSDYDIEWKLVGGKYKYVDIDDFGEEKVKTETLTYGISIDLYY